MNPVDWIVGGDTGISSECIWSVMMGAQARSPFGACTPWDPDDFGRCYRLLKQFPEWRPRLNEVAARYPKWGPLVEAWDELSAMYEKCCEPDGSYTRASHEANKPAAEALYNRMAVLIKAGNARSRKTTA